MPVTEIEKRVVGITGGIGSGKSEVARIFSRQGFYLIDADVIGHDLLKQNDVKDEIDREFGPDVFNAQGDIVRRKLGGIVFSHPQKLQQLNAITRPRINDRIIQLLGEKRGEKVVVDMATLFESRMESWFDVIVAVVARLEDRMRWIREKTGLSDDSIRDRMRRQLSTKEKCKRAHFCLMNTGTLSELEQQVQALIDSWG